MARRPAAARGMALNASLLLLAGGYAGANARDLYEPSPAPQHEILAALYSQPCAGGRPLLQWVEANIPASGAVVAAYGQATGYLLRRPTLSMVASEYSPMHWEAGEVEREMERFNAKYLVLYKPTPVLGRDVLLTESRFLAAAALDQPPPGFVIAAENAAVRILAFDGARRTGGQ